MAKASSLYQENFAWKGFQEFYIPWKILESPELLVVENSPLSISLVLNFCLRLWANKILQFTFLPLTNPQWEVSCSLF